MTPRERTEISKRMSFVLRHRPESVGLELDAAGWVDVDAFCAAMKLSAETLAEVVANNGKQRFELDATKKKIRASQGHSIDVDLAYEPSVPPPTLHHGTTNAAVETILREGLKKMSRHHVHLSVDAETAREVGRRRDPTPVVLIVDSAQMAADGHTFHVSTNGVWLVDEVLPKYLRRA